MRIDLSALDMAQADFAEANLRMADLSRADLREARLTGSFLSGALLNECNLVGANLIEASMIGASLSGADLSRADLSGADLTGANLRAAILSGAYLVGTFLNETDLTNAKLSGAYIRMAQMTGCDLTNAVLEGADLSCTDLTGVRLDGCSLAGANLTGANLSASTLVGCNLRDANLTNAILQGCNLSGAKLRDITYTGAKLDDAWADWIDLGSDNRNEERASLEEAFTGLLSKPIAQVLVEGRVSDEVWSVVITHLCEFQITHPNHADVRLRAIHQGIGSSALYLEADHELSIAAYLAEFADIIGKGSLELFENLAAAVANSEHPEFNSGRSIIISPFSSVGLATEVAPSHPPGNAQPSLARVEALQRAAFWTSEKAVLVLTGHRQVWLEASSSPLLTLRPPHGSAVGVDLIRGHFTTEDIRRNKTVGSK